MLSWLLRLDLVALLPHEHRDDAFVLRNGDKLPNGRQEALRFGPGIGVHVPDGEPHDGRFVARDHLSQFIGRIPGEHAVEECDYESPRLTTLFPRSSPSRAHGTTSFSTAVFHWAERQYH